MKKFILLLFILSFLALFGVIPYGIASAIEQPRSDIIKNNKFGIHILEPSDLPKAQELVNSSGGDWGFVTVVIRDDDMNRDKWQGFMDQCRERHLIPLVRIATHLEGINWAKPKIDDSQNWANFLGDLNWPVSDRYVIIFNEPNHAKEWGGDINPKEYSRILSDFSSKFKIQNSKFMILNAGLDLAAPNGKTTMDSYDFMRQMQEEVPGIFEKIDGWSSHSYPNHGYLGKPWDSGKHSIRGYDWELSTLKKDFGVKKELPVFITETGWPHEISNIKYQISKTGKKIKVAPKYYGLNLVAEYIKSAYENVWLKDERIMAVTPFVLNYPDNLFAEFAWLDKNGGSSLQFGTIRQQPKITWRPKQDFKAEVLVITLPPFLLAETEFRGKITLQNTGQSIWGEYEPTVSTLSLNNGEKIKPGEKKSFDFTLKSSTVSGEMGFGWENIGFYKIKVFPSSTLTNIKYTLWQKVILKIKSLLNQG